MKHSCLDIQAQLPAWLDGELSRYQSEAIRSHVAACSECCSVAKSLQQLDVRFENARACNHQVAARIAVNVLSSLAIDAIDRPVYPPLRTASRSVDLAPVSPARTQGAAKSFTTHFASLRNMSAAAAAGFLVAWLIFAPASRETALREDPQSGIDGQPSEPVPAESSLARLVAATGNVECRQAGQTDWSSPGDLSAFRCVSGTEVRTAAGVCCELETDDRCTIRLNEATELAILSSREIELRSGQVWCNAAADVELQVVTTAQRRVVPDTNSVLNLTCAASGSMISEVDVQGACRIQSADGEVDVSMGNTKRRIRRGEIARLENGQLIVEPSHTDLLLATGWMQPLLILKGHNSPELGNRVNLLLANLGRSKLDHLYEDEIRSLGEFAVLPLLRFVQSESSRNSLAQRLRAMSLIADIAPSWLIGDLIELLSDSEPQVRVNAAMALERLTRQSHGREPPQWSAPLSELEESLQRWHAWWKQNASRYEHRQKTENRAASKTV